RPVPRGDYRGIFYISSLLFSSPHFVRLRCGRFADSFLPACVLRATLRGRAVVAVKPRQNKGFPILFQPLDRDHLLGEPRPPQHVVQRFGGVSLDATVHAVRVKQTPNGHESANRPQVVRFQCGRNADNFRMREQVHTHLDPVSCHCSRPLPLASIRRAATASGRTAWPTPSGSPGTSAGESCFAPPLVPE